MRVNRKHGMAVVVGLALMFSSSCSNTAETVAADNIIEAEHVYRLSMSSEPPVLIDVRSDRELKSGYLANALHVPVREFVVGSYKKRLEGISKDALIVVYCHSGVRSNFAYRILKRSGYSNVLDFRGGMVEWQRTGLPVADSIPGQKRVS